MLDSTAASTDHARPVALFGRRLLDWTVTALWASCAAYGCSLCHFPAPDEVKGVTARTGEVRRGLRQLERHLAQEAAREATA